MKILVTGANGYLGQGIVKQLINDGVSVVATDLSTENIDSHAVKIKANIFEIDDPFIYFGQPDVVLHLAWRDGFIHNSELHIACLFQHYQFLEKMANRGCKRIAVMGTMHEIGLCEGPINEDTPCNPLTLYGIAKNSLRQLAFFLCEKKEVTLQWLRGFYMVGNSKYGNSIFSKITQAEERGDSLFPFTSGQNMYDFLDYDEFCFQACSAVEQDKVNGIINICSGTPQRLCDRVESFIVTNGYKIKLDYGKFPDRPYDSKAVWGDNKKICLILAARKNTDENC